MAPDWRVNSVAAATQWLLNFSASMKSPQPTTQLQHQPHTFHTHNQTHINGTQTRQTKKPPNCTTYITKYTLYRYKVQYDNKALLHGTLWSPWHLEERVMGGIKCNTERKVWAEAWTDTALVRSRQHPSSIRSHDNDWCAMCGVTKPGKITVTVIKTPGYSLWSFPKAPPYWSWTKCTKTQSGRTPPERWLCSDSSTGVNMWGFLLQATNWTLGLWGPQKQSTYQTVRWWWGGPKRGRISLVIWWNKSCVANMLYPWKQSHRSRV